MSIVTKAGDNGETGLLGGARVAKMNTRIHALGSADELDAMLGVIRTIGTNCSGEACFATTSEKLLIIQQTLYRLKADLASPSSHQTEPRITPNDIEILEQWITAIEKELTPLTHFIIPGGSPLAAQLHLARTICRRAERWVVQLCREERAPLLTISYLNRLGDFLFVEARVVNHEAGIDEKLTTNN